MSKKQKGKGLQDSLSTKQKNALKEQVEDIEDPSNTLKESMSFVISTGMPLPTMHNIDPEKVRLPTASELVSCTDSEVAEWMSEWTQLLNYANLELAKHEIERDAKQKQYDKKRKSFIRHIRDSEEGITESRAKEEADVNAELKRIEFQAEVAKAKFKLVEKLYKNYSQNYRLLSRELSRRGITTDANWRSSKNE